MFEYYIMYDDAPAKHVVRDTKYTLQELQAIVGGRIELVRIDAMRRQFSLYYQESNLPPVHPKYKDMYWMVVNENASELDAEDINEQVYGKLSCSVYGTAVIAPKESFFGWW